MPKVIWNGSVIAEAADDAVEIVEGNPDAVHSPGLTRPTTKAMT